MDNGPALMMTAILIVACYLIGSIPTAWLVAEIHHGQDIRRLGSGNVGVMNTALSVHRWAGLVVFLSEVAKGVAAVLLGRMSGGGDAAVGSAALAVIAGTRWPVWLKFAGGRGNTAGMAALTCVSWVSLAAALLVFLAGRLLTGSNFLAMRICLLLLPLLMGLLTGSWWWVLFGALFSLMFLSTHRPESDDHLLLKARYPTLWAFLTSPPRK